jgi:hypothetical protein
MISDFRQCGHGPIGTLRNVGKRPIRFKPRRTNHALASFEIQVNSREVPFAHSVGETNLAEERSEARSIPNEVVGRVYFHTQHAP